MSNSGIRFNDYFFSEPLHLAAWTPPRCAGLFAVLVSDPNWAPKGYQPLFFGELGNNSPAPSVLRDCSEMVAAAPGKTLFVSVLPMPFSTTQQRLALRKELISAYNPAGQMETQATHPHREQTAQMWSPAGTNAPVDVSPVPRRRIGFVT